MRRVVRLAVVAAATSLVVWVAPDPSSATGHQLSAEPSRPVSTASEADDINDSGMVVGAACSDSVCTNYDAVTLWRGTVHHLGTLGGYGSVAFAVNDRGEVVGQADRATTAVDGSAVSVAFAATPTGGLHSVGTLRGLVDSRAVGVNDRGDIVGVSYSPDPSGGPAPGIRAFLWHHGSMRDLGDLGGGDASAFAINNAGVIVGRSSIASGDQRGFYLDQGGMREIPTLGGNFSELRSVNRWGEAAGSSTTDPSAPGGSGFHAVIYRPGGRLIDLGTLGGHNSQAFAINDRGEVAGVSDTADGSHHSFIWRHGSMYDLGVLPGGVETDAYGMNNRGTVVGVADTGVPDVNFGGTVFHAVRYDRTLSDLGSLQSDSPSPVWHARSYRRAIARWARL